MKRLVATVAVSVVVYLALGPPHDGDLAAQTARADLFGRAGFVPWFAGWYAGLHVAGYSLTTPALMWWLGPAGLGALCLAATGLLGLALLRTGRARRPVLGAAALTVFQLFDLLSGRVTFAAGAVLVLAAVLAAERRCWWLAGPLALLAAVTSPVDGLVGGLAALVYLLGDPTRRGQGWALGAGSVAGLAVTVLPFPDPGVEPFALSTLLWSLVTSLLVAVSPVGRRVRLAALLSMLLVVGSFLVASPVGSNAARVAMLLALPVLLASARLGALVLVPLALLLLPWPLFQLANDLSAARDPAAQAGFYAPLLGELRTLPALGRQRLEVVEPRTHWQVVYLEPTATLARGWDRQLDEALNPLFYGAPLTAASYRAFLQRNAVGAVALPVGTPIDFGSAAEARLVRAGLGYLHRVWSDPHWVLYLVVDPAPLARGDGARVNALTATGVDLTTSGPGRVELALRYSHYLVVSGGRVVRAGDGDAELLVDRGGEHRVHAVWSLAAVLAAVLHQSR